MSGNDNLETLAPYADAAGAPEEGDLPMRTGNQAQPADWHETNYLKNQERN